MKASPHKRLYNREYYKKNKEKIRRWVKRYHRKNKEKINRRVKRYYKKNKEKIGRQVKRYYAKNKEKYARRNKRYRIKHKEKLNRHSKRYYAKNKEKLRDLQYRRHYGISTAEVKRLQKLQKNKCAICARRFSETPYVDHDHKTGKVRGLLCRFCNTGLGMFQDSCQSLKTAITYLTADRI